MTARIQKKLIIGSKLFSKDIYRFICCKLDVGCATFVVKAVSECRLRACCEIFGGGAGGVVAAMAFVMGLLGVELEFELV